MVALPSLRLIAAALATLLVGLSLTAQPTDVYPVHSGPSSQSLDGAWQFKYVAGSVDAIGADAAFSSPAFSGADAWQPIKVPGHWELQGFAEPKYGKELAAGTGLYRRTFRVPNAWKGQRIYLRFEGVLFGFDAWVNGVKAGSWASGYNPCTFDVTDALKPGGDNLLAVQVTTRDKGWEFDTNDCWSISGIYRDVTLFALPETHLTDFTAQTTLTAAGGAELKIAAAASGAASAHGRLFSPAGKMVQEFQFPLGADAKGSTTLTVTQPQLWTAETPILYRIELDLVAGERVVQQISEKIGLRQVTIEGAVLKLNGVPIKLHGIDHHDIWPEVGRAATEELMRRDLALIKAANINFIRTSHYPPHPRFIELCDELGIYVMCEVPFGFGDEHLTDPSYQDILLTRARATVRRDKNHPSIIVWSVGNENPITDIQLETGREVKRLDPTRPICFPTVGSYFARNYQKFPDFVDIYAPHYPVAKTLRDFAEKLTRPIIATEYAHQLGLASDRVQEEWPIMQQSPRIAGGAVWMFQDQGVLRTSEKSADEAAPNPHVWLDEHRYYDTNGLDGMDGIVYSDRTPQVDYWQVRKVYSPVQIPEHTLKAGSGPQQLVVHVENHFDFRALTGMKLTWSLERNGVAVQNGLCPLQAVAQATETVSIPVTVPASNAGDIFSVALHCVDEAGQSFYERELRLEMPGPIDPTTELFAELKAATLKVERAGMQTRIIHPRFVVVLDSATGSAAIQAPDGTVLVDGIYPHAGRRFTEAEKLRAKNGSIWTGTFLTGATPPEVDVSETAEGVQVRVRGKYPRPGMPDQSLDGEYRLLVRPGGTIKVSYEYALTQATGSLLEAGLSLVLPANATEFRWIGQGPYAGYPGKDALNEFGLYHLSRADIRFQGNRRETDVALLTSSRGQGVLLQGSAMEVAVENLSEKTVLSQNALVSGRGNKGSGPDSPIKADAIKTISGKFILLPLDPAWPATLTHWFGQPSAPVEVQHPFYRSYDQ